MTIRQNLAAVTILATLWAGIPIAVTTITPEPAPPFELHIIAEPPPEPVWTDTALLLTFEGPPPTLEPTAAPTASPQPTSSFGETSEPATIPPATDRDRALATLADLGAPAWVVRGFDCIASSESGWASIRSRYQNSNGTYDHGVFQLNDVHWPRLNRLGLDPYIPEHAATFVMVLWRESGFGPWSATRWGCGV